jgi:hypothetical protein
MQPSLTISSPDFDSLREDDPPDDEALDLLEEGAAQGIDEARYQLAIRLTQGRGIESDPQRVAALYAQAANGGHPGAMYGLGACYEAGYGVAADPDAALHWYSAAAQADEPNAWFALGANHHRSGRYHGAVKCFERAAELGYKDALFALALAYGRGEGVLPDDDRMRQLTARAAEAEHTEAQYWLASYYRYGQGEFSQDLKRAAHWYERASVGEHPKATYYFGLQTLLGHGVEQNIEKGWGLMEKAAKLGAVDAMICMATMIDSGRAPVDDPEMALYWYQEAADKGHAEAQFITGKRLLNIPNEKRFAREYLKKSAVQGNADAKALLDQIGAEESKPVPPDNSGDLAKAITGDPRSQYQMGFALFMGVGVPRNMPMSYFWFKVLSRTMPPQAAPMLQLLSVQVPEVVRGLVDRIADEWTPGMAPPAIS